MKKVFLILLSALLLGTACMPVPSVSAGANAPLPEETVAPVPASEDVSATEQTVPTPSQWSAVAANEAQPLFLTEAKNTQWADDASHRLMIYEDGTAYLFTANEIFTLETSDDGFLLKNELYRTPFDVAPAAVLPAGTVKITVDRDAVELKVVDDPASILTFAGLDGAVLTKEKHTPYPYPDFNFFSGPLEPGTEWFCYFDMGEHRHAKLSITVGEDGAMSGVLTMPDGTARSCVLFGNGNTFALTTDTEKEAELIFLGERKKTDETHYDRARYELMWLDLLPVFDFQGLTATDKFELGRVMYGEWDLRYILGKSLDSVILALIRDGWTETKDMEAQYPALEGWFDRLVKDGQTLMIHSEPDFSSPYEYYQEYPDAYVLYGADGAVLSWGGSKPIDHRIADSYRIGKGTYFDPGTGVRGMIVGEDSDAYFLDDGRIAVETTAHEGVGDVNFEIIRVIP